MVRAPGRSVIAAKDGILEFKKQARNFKVDWVTYEKSVIIQLGLPSFQYRALFSRCRSHP